MKYLHSYWHRSSHQLILALILFSSGTTLAQTTYTWNGSQSSVFSDTLNWTPNGLPGSGDDIIIVSTANDPLLGQTSAINDATVNSGTLQLGGHTLTVNGALVLNSGTVQNGLLKKTSGTADLNGTTMDCEVDITGSIQGIDNTRFKGRTTLYSTKNFNAGGNVFEDTVDIVIDVGNTTNFSNALPDTFLAPVSFTLANTGILVITHDAVGSYFADDVTLVNHSGHINNGIGIGGDPSASARFEGDIILEVDSTSGDINFSQGTIEHDGQLLIGSEGYHSGTLYLTAYTQVGTDVVDLSGLSHDAELRLGPDLTLSGELIGPEVTTWIRDGCRFQGDVLLPHLSTWDGGTTFEGKADLTLPKSHLSTGGNVFKDTTVIMASSAQGHYQRFGVAEPDTFLAPVSFTVTTDMDLVLAHSSAGNHFADVVTLSNFSGNIFRGIGIGGSDTSSTYFDAKVFLNVDSTSSGPISFSQGDNQHADELLIGAQGYHSGTLYLSSYTNTGTPMVDLSAMDHDAKLSLGPDLVFENQFKGPQLPTEIEAGCLFRSNTSIFHITDWGGSRFEGPAVLTTDIGYQLHTGGNVFTDTTWIRNISTGELRLGVNEPDTFLAPVGFNLEENGRIILAYNSAGNLYADDLSLIRSSPVAGGWINVGASGSSGIVINGDVTVLNDSTDGIISFTEGNIVHNGLLYTGYPDFSIGELHLKGYVQTAQGAIDLTGMQGDAKLTVSEGTDITADFTFEGGAEAGRFSDVTFRGNVDIEAPNLAVVQCNFLGTTYLKKTGEGDDGYSGGNVFHGYTYIENASEASGFSWGNNLPDTFLADLHVANFSNKVLDIARSHATPIGGNLNLSGAMGAHIHLGIYSRVLFNGTGDQSIIIQDGIEDRLWNVGIDKPSGEMLINTNHLTVHFELELIQGEMVFSGQDSTGTPHGLIVLGGAVVSGANDQSYVNGPVTSLGNGPFTFPVGDQGVYKPISMTAPNSVTNSFTVTYHRDDLRHTLTDQLGQGGLEYLSPVDHWQVTTAPGSGDAYWSVSWHSQDGYSNFSTSELRVAGWDGEEWDDLGAGTLTGDETGGTLESAARVELDSITFLALGSTNPNMLPKAFTVLVDILKQPTDTTYGIMTLNPDDGMGDSFLLLDDIPFPKGTELAMQWQFSGIVDSIYSFFGDSLLYTDTLEDVLTGRVQNWVEPGLYDVKFVDDQGRVAQGEALIAADKEFATMDSISYSSDTLSKTSSQDGWDSGYGSPLHFLDSTANGAFSFKVADTTGLFAIGFKGNEVPDTGGYAHMDYAAVFNGSEVQVWADGVLATSVNSADPDDEFRIERRGMTYRLLRNELGIHSSNAAPKRLQPAFGIHTGLLKPITGLVIFIPPLTVKFKVEHAACGNPASGGITADPTAFLLALPNATTFWERTDGDDPQYMPGDLSVTGVEAGTYIFGISFTGFTGQTIELEWTVHVDNLVDWQNLHDAVNSPNDASIVRLDPFLESPPDFFSATAGADSDNELVSTVGDGRVSFHLAEDATIGVIGISPETAAGDFTPGSVEEGIISFHIGIGNSAAQWFVHNNVILNGGVSGPELRFTPRSAEMHIEKQGTTIDYTYGLNHSPINTVHNVQQSMDWIIDTSPILYAGGYLNAHTNLTCMPDPFYGNEPCALLRKELDGGYHWTLDGKLNFQIDEEYMDGGDLGSGNEQELDYAVYDASNNVLISNGGGNPNTINDDGLKYYGDNRYRLNLSNVINNGFYVLEVTSEKDEKYYLRFKKGY